MRNDHAADDAGVEPNDVKQSGLNHTMHVQQPDQQHMEQPDSNTNTNEAAAGPHGDDEVVAALLSRGSIDYATATAIAAAAAAPDAGRRPTRAAARKAAAAAIAAAAPTPDAAVRTPGSSRRSRSKQQQQQQQLDTKVKSARSKAQGSDSAAAAGIKSRSKRNAAAAAGDSGDNSSAASGRGSDGPWDAATASDSVSNDSDNEFNDDADSGNDFAVGSSRKRKRGAARRSTAAAAAAKRKGAGGSSKRTRSAAVAAAADNAQGDDDDDQDDEDEDDHAEDDEGAATATTGGAGPGGQVRSLEERRRIRREKNRLAARKCRAKKIKMLESMQQAVEKVTARCEEVKRQLAEVKVLHSREVNLSNVLVAELAAAGRLAPGFSHLPPSLTQHLTALGFSTVDQLKSRLQQAHVAEQQFGQRQQQQQQQRAVKTRAAPTPAAAAAVGGPSPVIAPPPMQMQGGAKAAPEAAPHLSPPAAAAPVKKPLESPFAAAAAAAELPADDDAPPATPAADDDAHKANTRENHKIVLKLPRVADTVLDKASKGNSTAAAARLAMRQVATGKPLRMAAAPAAVTVGVPAAVVVNSYEKGTSGTAAAAVSLWHSSRRMVMPPPVQQQLEQQQQQQQAACNTATTCNAPAVSPTAAAPAAAATTAAAAVLHSPKVSSPVVGHTNSCSSNGARQLMPGLTSLRPRAFSPSGSIGSPIAAAAAAASLVSQPSPIRQTSLGRLLGLTAPQPDQAQPGSKLSGLQAAYQDPVSGQLARLLGPQARLSGLCQDSISGLQPGRASSLEALAAAAATLPTSSAAPARTGVGANTTSGAPFHGSSASEVLHEDALVQVCKPQGPCITTGVFPTPCSVCLTAPGSSNRAAALLAAAEEALTGRPGSQAGTNASLAGQAAASGTTPVQAVTGVKDKPGSIWLAVKTAAAAAGGKVAAGGNGLSASATAAAAMQDFASPMAGAGQPLNFQPVTPRPFPVTAAAGGPGTKEYSQSPSVEMMMPSKLAANLAAAPAAAAGLVDSSLAPVSGLGMLQQQQVPIKMRSKRKAKPGSSSRKAVGSQDKVDPAAAADMAPAATSNAAGVAAGVAGLEDTTGLVAMDIWAQLASVPASAAADVAAASAPPVVCTASSSGLETSMLPPKKRPKMGAAAAAASDPAAAAGPHFMPSAAAVGTLHAAARDIAPNDSSSSKNAQGQKASNVLKFSLPKKGKRQQQQQQEDTDNSMAAATAQAVADPPGPQAVTVPVSNNPVSTPFDFEAWLAGAAAATAAATGGTPSFAPPTAASPPPKPRGISSPALFLSPAPSGRLNPSSAAFGFHSPANMLSPAASTRLSPAVLGVMHSRLTSGIGGRVGSSAALHSAATAAAAGGAGGGGATPGGEIDSRCGSFQLPALPHLLSLGCFEELFAAANAAIAQDETAHDGCSGVHPPPQQQQQQQDQKAEGAKGDAGSHSGSGSKPLARTASDAVSAGGQSAGDAITAISRSPTQPLSLADAYAAATAAAAAVRGASPTSTARLVPVSTTDSSLRHENTQQIWPQFTRGVSLLLSGSWPTGIELPGAGSAALDALQSLLSSGQQEPAVSTAIVQGEAAAAADEAAGRQGSGAAAAAAAAGDTAAECSGALTPSTAANTNLAAATLAPSSSAAGAAATPTMNRLGSNLLASPPPGLTEPTSASLTAGLTGLSRVPGSLGGLDDLAVDLTRLLSISLAGPGGNSNMALGPDDTAVAAETTPGNEANPGPLVSAADGAAAGPGKDHPSHDAAISPVVTAPGVQQFGCAVSAGMTSGDDDVALVSGEGVPGLGGVAQQGRLGSVRLLPSVV